MRLVTLMATALLGGCAMAPEPDRSQWLYPLQAPGSRVEQEGGFELDLSADEALHQFTPEGERAWAPGWDPVYVHRVAGEGRGTVFVTAAERPDPTYWYIVTADPVARRMTYVRITPGVRLAEIDVQVSPRGAQRSRVAVRYAHIALSARGEELNEASRAEDFGAVMRTWRERIESGRSGRPAPAHGAH